MLLLETFDRNWLEGSAKVSTSLLSAFSTLAAMYRGRSRASNLLDINLIDCLDSVMIKPDPLVPVLL